MNKVKVSKGISSEKMNSFYKTLDVPNDVKIDTDAGVVLNLTNGIFDIDYAETPVDSNTGAKREKLNSIRYDYMPSRIVNDAYARVASFGAKKYEPWNWAKGLPMSQIKSSLERHLWAYFEGEDKDDESKLSHLDHVLWNAIALVYNEYHQIQDDRFKNIPKHAK